MKIASSAVSKTARSFCSCSRRTTSERSRSIAASIRLAAVRSASVSAGLHSRSATQSSKPMKPHHSPWTKIGTVMQRPDLLRLEQLARAGRQVAHVGAEDLVSLADAARTASVRPPRSTCPASPRCRAPAVMPARDPLEALARRPAAVGAERRSRRGRSGSPRSPRRARAGAAARRRASSAPRRAARRSG